MVLIINLEQTSLVIRALCEREYLQPSSVLSLDSDRVQRIKHSSGVCVSCERGDVTFELYCMYNSFLQGIFTINISHQLTERKSGVVLVLHTPIIKYIFEIHLV